MKPRKHDPTIYIDGGSSYLELHALRAPVGHYCAELTAEEYDQRVQEAIADFELFNHCTLRMLGRSGRHVCLDDTPSNRRRYRSLQRKAIAAAQEMWDSMREIPA